MSDLSDLSDLSDICAAKISRAGKKARSQYPWVKYRGAPFSHKSYLLRCITGEAPYTVLSAIGGCSVEQGRVLRRVRCGSVPLYTTKPAQAQGSRLPAMRHRSLNNFHKKMDNNDKTAGCDFGLIQ